MTNLYLLIAPPFTLGAVVATPGVIKRVPLSRSRECLQQHVRGDWGCVPADDAQQNNEALIHGDRILSAYLIEPDKPKGERNGNVFWIITEADRSVTTLLLPSEY
jgi:hypothetical protein